MSNIAFIGVGNMGGGMAANLVKAGMAVTAFDLSAEASAKAKASGCLVAASAAEAANGAETVITMLPAGVHVRQVFQEVVAPNVPAGALYVDCSTIDVESARAVGEAAAAKRLRFADAPVSGGVAAADAGNLTFMVGCADWDFGDVEALLKPMARTVVRAGVVGAGQSAKICNNMLLGISMLGVAEAFALAEKLGLAPERFFEIASQSSGQCWSLTSYCPWPGPVPAAPSNRSYEGGFLSSLMLKDLKLAQAAAAGVGAATPLGAQAEALYALFAGLGFGGRDFSAVLQLMRGKLETLQPAPMVTLPGSRAG